MSHGFCQQLLESLADLMWPNTCAACSTRLPAGTIDPLSRVFCGICKDSLIPTSSPSCPVCGLPYPGGRVDHLCGSCLTKRPDFESAHAPYLYGGALVEAISRLKYAGATWLARPLGDLLVMPAAEIKFDLIIPVPLHRRRLVERGFNQSALLASRVAQRLGMIIDTTHLVRTKDTPPQAGLNRAQRLSSMRGAFRGRRSSKLVGARVLLIDDVVTTTATVDAAASSLRRAGVISVEVLSLAHAEWSLSANDLAQVICPP